MQEYNPQPQNGGWLTVTDRAVSAPAFIVVALICCGLAVSGWATGRLDIAGFGNSRYLMQPLSAVGFSAVSVALLCSMAELKHAARTILIVPLLIVVVTTFQDLTHISLGTDGLLFPDSITLQWRISPGRPGPTPTLSLALLSFATFSTTIRNRLLRRAIIIVASLALVIALVAGLSIPLGLSAPNGMTRHVMMSVPTAATVTALSLAIIAHRRQVNSRARLLCGVRGSTIRMILAGCVLIPILSAIARLWTDSHTDIPIGLAELVQAGIQVTVSCSLGAWAWARISRESAERWALTKALDSAPITITDIHGRILRWSEGCERLYGWSSDEAVGRFKHELTKAARDALQGGTMPLYAQPCEKELTECRKDGTAIHVIEHQRIVTVEGELDPVIVFSMTDISARKHAEQAMRASELRLSLAVEAHEVGIFEWSAATDVFQMSPHAERLFGIAPGAFQGGMQEWLNHLRTVFGHDVLPTDASKNPEARSTFSLRSINGNSPRIIEGTVRVLGPPHGADSMMVGIVMDATERERRARMLEARESELRTILETMPEAMITIDEDGNIRSFSSTAEKLFGYKADDVLGRDVRLLLPEYFHFGENGASSVQNGATPDNKGDDALMRMTAGLDRDGNEMPVELAVGAASIGDKQISIAFVRNLREQLATQARLSELRDQLLHVSRVSAMGEMGAGLAHELNQPLTATANFLGALDLLLAQEADPAQLRKFLRLASAEVLRAGDIIRHMRAFVAKGDLYIRAEPLDEIISDAIQLARSRVRRPDIGLRYDPDPARPFVLADRVQIQQVLVNIVTNALDALDGHEDIKPEIRIEAHGMDDGMVMIRVIDNGPGLPSEFMQRPFEAFVSTKAHGMGIGLSICRRIIEAHGGSFTARNGADCGATIEFTLPINSDMAVSSDQELSMG
ncbi:PAS domain S-box protein [Sphingobium sp. H39-3-25]|uniref:PAS domain S-box protein n=1 Tax=Sphingobium arseniciresistens TaxID=3030834 RepID=UPI0023B90B8C|nr:PAS domain S-box protein [Sphingobium arseniciresistens]